MTLTDSLFKRLYLNPLLKLTHPDFFTSKHHQLQNTHSLQSIQLYSNLLLSKSKSHAIDLNQLRKTKNIPLYLSNSIPVLRNIYSLDYIVPNAVELNSLDFIKYAFKLRILHFFLNNHDVIDNFDFNNAKDHYHSLLEHISSISAATTATSTNSSGSFDSSKKKLRSEFINGLKQLNSENSEYNCSFLSTLEDMFQIICFDDSIPSTCQSKFLLKLALHLSSYSSNRGNSLAYRDKFKLAIVEDYSIDCAYYNETSGFFHVPLSINLNHLTRMLPLKK